MKNLKSTIAIATLLLSIWSCGNKKKEKGEAFLPVASIIKGQINNIDTSLYAIIKVTYIDSNRSDTQHIRREDVRNFAQDFLTLPELSKKKYTEENISGPTEGLSTFIYKPINPDKEELQQVDIIINPAIESEGKSQITTIILKKMFSNKDSSVRKELLWQMDKSFQVVTVKQLPGQEETVSSYRLIWNQDEKE